MAAPVEITNQALLLTSEYLSQMRKDQPDSDFVAGLTWGPSRTKYAEKQEWCDMRTRFTIGFFERQKIPAEAIRLYGSTEVVLYNSSGDPDGFNGKKIDLHDDCFTLIEQ